MKSLNLNLGVEDYLLAGKVAVSFNPTDMNFLERLSHAFSELDALQEEVRQSREKITDDREVFPIARALDGKMRGILNDLFGKEICEPLFGSMNLFASSGGLPLWAIAGTLGIWLLAIVLTYLLVKFVFKDMSLSQPFVKNGKE